jgi:hypothetical protein
MAAIPESVRYQLKDRWDTVLSGAGHLTLYIRPGSSRLILPAGLGCPTCEDARQMAELLRDAAPEKITLDVVDVVQAGVNATSSSRSTGPLTWTTRTWPTPGQKVLFSIRSGFSRE